MTDENTTNEVQSSAPVKKAVKKVVKKVAVKKVTAKAEPKAEKAPRVKKADTFTPGLLKYLSKHADGKTRSELLEHFDVADFGGALLNDELFRTEVQEGRTGKVYLLTAKGKKQAASAK